MLQQTGGTREFADNDLMRSEVICRGCLSDSHRASLGDRLSKLPPEYSKPAKFSNFAGLRENGQLNQLSTYRCNRVANLFKSAPPPTMSNNAEISANPGSVEFISPPV